METPQTGPGGKSRNMDRFVYYFAGLAIGCVILGMVQMARARQAAKAGVVVSQPAGSAVPPGGAIPSK